MKCLKCKTEMQESTTTFVAELDNCCVVVRHVPCLICEECGEEVYTGVVAGNLEKICRAVREAVAEVMVISYRDAVA